MSRVLSKIPVGKIKPLRVSQSQKLIQQKIGKADDRKEANAAQYEKEKAARATTGSRYGYDTMGGNTSSTYTNTRARTFREFIEIANAVLNEAPYQIYGPDPHGSSDSESRPLGKPYKNKKRAKTRTDKLDQEIGGYRHFVRKVD